MPLIYVTLTPGAFDAAAQDKLARGLTDAAARAESIPDEPGPRARDLVLIQELAAGRFYSSGAPAEHAVRGVFATLEVSAGVLDAARKARLAADVQAAAESAAPDRSRPVITSLIIVEVPEGQWGQAGRIMRLPEMAAISRFDHLHEALVR
jgi:phenylpyruvate tautomerase PptA (4-oxalocrotonate tautomerase family)